MKIQNPFRLGLIGALGVGLGILILSAITSLATIITYIGAALFLALGIEPLISFLERRKFPRWLALVASLVVIIGAFIGLIWANRVSQNLRTCCGSLISSATSLMVLNASGPFDTALPPHHTANGGDATNRPAVRRRQLARH